MKQCCLCGKSGHDSADCGWRGYRKVSLSSEINRLERRIHNMTEAAEFLNIFDGYTEWRKWDERIPSWFSSINLRLDI